MLEGEIQDPGQEIAREEAGAGDLLFISQCLSVSSVGRLSGGSESLPEEGDEKKKKKGGGGVCTDEVAAMEADDDGTSARPDGFRDEDVGGDGVGVDLLVSGGVNIEGGKFLFDGCDDGGIHCWLVGGKGV